MLIPLLVPNAEPRLDRLATADDQRPVMVGDPTRLGADPSQVDEEQLHPQDNPARPAQKDGQQGAEQSRRGIDADRRRQERRQRNLPVLLDTRSGARRKSTTATSIDVAA